MQAQGATPPLLRYARVTKESPATSNPPRLPDKVRRCIRYRHYSYRAEQAYVEWAREVRGTRSAQAIPVCSRTSVCSARPMPPALAITGARTPSPCGPGNGATYPPASSTSSSPAIASHDDSSSST